MSEDIVERLRNGTDFWRSDCEIRMEAAKEIERLRAENERLRGALEPFSSFANENVDENGWISTTHRERIVDWFGPSDFREARAAITQKS